MKKTSLTVVLLLSVICAFAQKKAVKEASKEANKFENPNFQVARDIIAGALEHPETINDADTWYVAGTIETKAYDNDYYQKQLGRPLPNGEGAMYDALMNSYGYYLKAVSLDSLPNAKGKIKPVYTKKVRKTLAQNIYGFLNAGAYYYNNKDFKGAYDAWGVFLEIPQLPFMQGEEGLPHDSVYAEIRFNRAVAAINSGDANLKLDALKAAKNDVGETQITIYNTLITEYEHLRDTVNLINTLEEAESIFKNTLVETLDAQGNPVKDENGNVVMRKENNYTLKLINIFIFRGEYEKAIEKLDNVLAEDPNNAEFWNVKGNLYESQKETDKAIECFEKAIQINPNYADAYGNIGRIYFNQAVQRNNDISTASNTEYTKIRESEVLPLFKKALPYYEKAYKFDSDNSDYKYALRNIFYNLDDKRFEALEKGIYMPE